MIDKDSTFKIHGIRNNIQHLRTLKSSSTFRKDKRLTQIKKEMSPKQIFIKK